MAEPESETCEMARGRSNADQECDVLDRDSRVGQQRDEAVLLLPRYPDLSPLALQERQLGHVRSPAAGVSSGDPQLRQQAVGSSTSGVPARNADVRSSYRLMKINKLSFGVLAMRSQR